MIIAGLDCSKTHYSLVMYRPSLSRLPPAIIVVVGWSERQSKTWERKFGKLNTNFIFEPLPDRKDFTCQDSYNLVVTKALSDSIMRNVTSMIRNVHQHKEPFVVAIEDYAYSASPFSVIPIAEATGCVKLELAKIGAYIRMHDPLSAKLWATGKGNPDKWDMVSACIATKELGVLPELSMSGNANPIFDVADSYFLMSMLRTELMLRAGKVNVSSLPQNHIRVVNRVTQHFPVGLLDRPFASMFGDVPEIEL